MSEDSSKASTTISMPLLVLLAVALLPRSVGKASDELVSIAELRWAAMKGLAIVEKAARNYPKHRKCFSCHHQTLPMQAMVVARQHGLVADVELLQSQAKFTHASFSKRLERMKRGGGFDPISVGYGLWALDLAGFNSDQTTDTMITRLLKSQRDEGSWGRGSLRPPIQQSEVTSAVLAVHYMPKFVGPSQREAVREAAARTKEWLLELEPETQEDRNSQLGGLGLLRASRERIDNAKQAILDSQRKDGGWGQEGEMASDAYATGQTLFTLRRVGLPIEDAVYQRGLRFLLETQQADGSWLVESRSEPLQIFFDNGDPHGKNQFISIAATSYGTIALALALPIEQP